LPRKFVYHFSDGTSITVAFEEWGIYHMLGIQHIDYTIASDDFFNRIDNGLSFADFKTNEAIKTRFKNQKKRLAMFGCVYNTLRKGHVFYIPSRKVQNTNNVKVDYIIYRTLYNNNNNDTGINLGIRFENGKYVPLTILVSKQSSLMNYVDIKDFKLVEKLEIYDDSENIIETLTYALNPNIS
jgi:hypothetical protein